MLRKAAYCLAAHVWRGSKLDPWMSDIHWGLPHLLTWLIQVYEDVIKMISKKHLKRYLLKFKTTYTTICNIFRLACGKWKTAPIKLILKYILQLAELKPAIYKKSFLITTKTTDCLFCAPNKFSFPSYLGRILIACTLKAMRTTDLLCLLYSNARFALKNAS